VNVYYANDTQFHAGSIAVSVSIINRLNKQGHLIVGTCQRPNGPDDAGLEACDVLVVNGEGTFHDELGPLGDPERVKRLMLGLERAKQLGKRVHFINATWFNMTNHWGRVLSMLDEVAVREPMSALEMTETMGIRPADYLDASYYAPTGWNEWTFGMPDNKGKVVLGHIYPHNFPDRLTEDHPVFQKYAENYITMIPFDAQNQRVKPLMWPEVVRSLKGASLYITGQHHGVYAACKARTPFVYCKCNTWKVEGLFGWAGVDIPFVRNAADVPHCIEWALSNPPEFKKLWDFMDTRPEWPGVLG
jgi:hypothetical protein